MTSPAGGVDGPAWKPGLNEWVLGGIVVLTVFFIALGALFYLLPGDHLQIPELQPAVRVTRERDLPAGSSRVVSWGSRIILVVRVNDSTYAAVDGVSPLDGCILGWDQLTQRVVSPCSYLVYDLRGDPVRGLSTVPLHRYAVFVREGAIFVTEAR